jgi:hypothetical protein
MDKGLVAETKARLATFWRATPNAEALLANEANRGAATANFMFVVALVVKKIVIIPRLVFLKSALHLFENLSPLLFFAKVRLCVNVPPLVIQY